MKKTKWYCVYSDDRKQHLQGYMLIRTDPKGGPYAYRWVNTDGVVQDNAPYNTHKSAIVDKNTVSYLFLHRRCRPAKVMEWFYEEVETQFRIDLGVDTDDTPEFIEESPIKMGATYNPDAQPAN
jgi:hypothetical protein